MPKPFDLLWQQGLCLCQRLRGNRRTCADCLCRDAATADQTASALDSTPEEDSYVQGGGLKLAPKGNSDSGNADEDDNDGDNSNENEECPVCLGTNDVVCITKCNHVFCRECIIGWVGLNHSCPMCRTSLAPEIDVSFL